MTEQRVASAAPDGISTPTLLLLVESDRNRELLTNQFSDVAVQTHADDPFSEPTFDLCLLDIQSFQRYREQLEAEKEAAEPTFLPYLLLTGTHSPDDLSSAITDTVDEVIQRPVSKTALNVRVENLLERRALSLELTRQKDQSEQRFKTLFHASPDPVLVGTADGIVTEVNSAFTTTFDVDASTVTGASISTLQLSPSTAVEQFHRQMTGDASDTTMVEWELENDTRLVTELRTASITDRDTDAERIGIFRDITERIEKQENLERQNERLETFADTIAHDLRNPLAIAIGQLSLSREGDTAEHLDSVERAHERIKQLIDELLTLAKQGRTVLDPDVVALRQAVETSWSHVDSHEATLTVDIDPVTTVLADEGRLYELFENLFRNAIEHGGETVAVHVGTLTDDRGFYVEDDGPGIPPERRAEVFEAGFTDAPEGTGLGLSIVQQIVEGHDWNISIREGASAGARFEVTGIQSA
ncbi:ATP-binding protein [Haladaptatus sp. DJG-WS-42]|uniref:sensor histidine kinase n=1 Tax=Haladaptatus sp. DJG-WS-42 TaxID=3120516 RepID=UPI0030CAFC1E